MTSLASGPGESWVLVGECRRASLSGCREAGARVSTNVFLRDLDLPIARHDARRLEVVADGLPLFGGAQFVVPFWFLQSRPTVTHAVVVQRRMVPLSSRPASGNS